TRLREGLVDTHIGRAYKRVQNCTAAAAHSGYVILPDKCNLYTLVRLMTANKPDAPKEAELKTTKILAVFLSVSAVALGLPAEASAESELRSAGNEVAEDLRKGAAAVGEFAGDALITTKVKAAIVAHEDLKALDIG